MMKHPLILTGLIGLFFSCSNKAGYLSFDRCVPGMIPELFAESLLSPNGQYIGYCEFSADGSELYYTETTDKWFPTWLMKVSASDLSRKDPVKLMGSDFEGEPCFTKDGKTLFITAIRSPQNGRWQSDIFRLRKNENGWDTPMLLDSLVNSSASEWKMSCTKNNTIYFASEREKGTSAWNADLYKARYVNEKVVGLQKLPDGINTSYHESDPLIAPDESFLIFHSNRPGGSELIDKDSGITNCDLYISFNRKGNWTKPVNMGPLVNSEQIEMAPALTPDGKYFLFTRRKSLHTDKSSEIFWVSAKILENYRPLAE